MIKLGNSSFVLLRHGICSPNASVRGGGRGVKGVRLSVHDFQRKTVSFAFNATSGFQRFLSKVEMFVLECDS